MGQGTVLAAGESAGIQALPCGGQTPNKQTDKRVRALGTEPGEIHDQEPPQVPMTNHELPQGVHLPHVANKPGQHGLGG